MGIKNSTAPVSVENLKREGDAWTHASTSPKKTTGIMARNETLANSNGVAVNVPNNVPEQPSKRDWEDIVQNFGKLNPLSTFVMKRGAMEDGTKVKKKLIYEIYETLTEEMLFRAEHHIRDTNFCCLLWGVQPILIHDCLDENEIAILNYRTQVVDGVSCKTIEIVALNTVVGYIHVRSDSISSYEIADDKRNKLFSVQRKTLGFKYAEYQVKTESPIEVSVLVATVRTPREGKVFTEMRPSLSVTCKALIMSFSLYLLTLNE